MTLGLRIVRPALLEWIGYLDRLVGSMNDIEKLSFAWLTFMPQTASKWRCFNSMSCQLVIRCMSIA